MSPISQRGGMICFTFRFHAGPDSGERSMDTSSFGFWAMIAFWGSAISGIVIGISWARTRNKNPVDRGLLIKSLQHRLESGEITQEEYEKKLNALSGNQ